jgi:aerobic-type carbon monoxide dehydrogenase small subunit (CoxS/CutS family)
MQAHSTGVESFLKEIGDMPYKLTVNGQSRTIDVPPDMPLLWVLNYRESNPQRKIQSNSNET